MLRFYFAVGVFFLATCVYAVPAQIVLIPHGEKDAVGNELNPQGCARAYLLPQFFLASSAINRFGAPAAVFAARPNHEDGSIRPIQTMAPTAYVLGVKVQAPATRSDYRTIVDRIFNDPSYSGKTVLIAWEHKALPGLAQALGAVLSPEIQTWPGVVFDEAWVLNYQNTSRPPTLAILPERVLPTDNPEGDVQWRNGPRTSTGVISQEVSSLCVNNSALNSLASSLTVSMNR